ncbi:14526_t:CDS:2 [Entrophospora sp. SA101]|nr:14524_t:CDS:2 [Entrophospora sp. SA101]CAJ0631400.1 14526_t:CDS:2 [Entrophospora sp. SA101]
MFDFPVYDSVNGLKCSVSEYKEQKVFGTFGSQLGTFIPIAFLIFTVAVYGTKSVFGYMKTCLIDDVVILTSSLVPMLSWYIFGKPLWYNLIKKDTDDLYKITEDFVNIYGKNLSAINKAEFLDRINDINENFNKERWNKPNVIIFGKMTNKNLFVCLKTVIIWIYLIHSIVLLFYTYSETKYFYDQFDVNDELYTNENGTELYYANYEDDNSKTGPIISTIFNSLLVTILTRSIASFFSSQGIVKVEDIDKHYYKNYRHAVFAKMNAENIQHFNHFYKSDFYDKDDTLEGRELKRYKVDSVDGYVYVTEEPDSEKPDSKEPLYYYVLTNNKSVYFRVLKMVSEDEDNGSWSWKSLLLLFKNKEEERIKRQVKKAIRKLIKEDKETEVDKKVKSCVKHYCEGVKQKEDTFILKVDQELKKKEMSRLITDVLKKNNIPVKEEEDDDMIDKNKDWKIEGYVLVNVLQTGFLNYIFYSHRVSEKNKPISKVDNKPTPEEDIEDDIKDDIV